MFQRSAVRCVLPRSCKFAKARKTPKASHTYKATKLAESIYVGERVEIRMQDGAFRT